MENMVQPSHLTAAAEVDEPLRIVVVYENTAAHVRALHIRDYLAARLGSEIDIAFSWWSFDLLRDESEAVAAIRATLSADLIIFSAQPGDEWPANIKAWIESWARLRSGRPGAIAVIFSPPGPASRAICGRQTALHTVASSVGMDFLPQQVERWPSPNFAQAEKFLSRVIPAAIVSRDFPDRPDSSPYWGING